MFKKIQKPISTFEKYFREADDNEDQVSVTVAPRKNRGTDYGDDSVNVKVAPRNNRGTDYGEDDEQEESQTTQPETQDAEPEDYTSEDPNQDDQSQETEQNENNDNENDDTENQEEEPDSSGPNLGDGEEDYSSDDTADETGDENPDNEEDNSNDSENTESEEDKNEALKKYHLYKRFLHLYNIIESFNEKIRDVVKSDATQNAVLKTVSNNLTNLSENMFDFMTIRYKSSSHIQVLIYFETAISIVKLNFELLRNNKINLKQ